MDLNGAKIFVRVVQLGSFTKAAAELNLPNSTVSDRVSDLEKALGVSLLVRTTRKLRLTDAGSIFFTKAELAVATLTNAGQEASSFQHHPTGTLKITAPVDFDYTLICEAATEYAGKFPAVNVEILLTDRIVDLVGEGFDIAIRASPIKDAGFTAKRLGEAGLILVAAPQYLKQATAITQPSELASHQCLVILPEQDTKSFSTWDLVSIGGEKARIAPRARISSNSVGAIKHLALTGEGIALMPPTLVHREILREQLVHVLPEWSTPSWPSYLIYASQRNSSPKVKEMIPLLEPRVRSIVW